MAAKHIQGSRRRHNLLRRIIMAVILVLALVLIFQNTGETTIRLLGPQVAMPLSLALLGIGVVGAIIGLLYGARRR